MSEYNADILSAQARHKRLYFMLAAMVAGIAFILFVLIALLQVISVEVAPQDAADSASLEVEEGVGFSLRMKAYTFSANPVLKIAAPGFRSQLVEILPEHGGKLRVTLQELPGKLSVETNPSGEVTRWLLGGQLLAVGRAWEKELPAGEYELQIDSPYHEKKNIDVRLSRGQEQNLSVDLSAVTGQIDITSVPEGVPIKIDGIAVGVTPYSSPRKGGSYKIEIITPAYETISDQVEITNVAPSASRNYRLLPKKAYLDIQLVPAAGVLMLNGRQLENASPVAIEAGVANTLIYLKSAYFPQTQEFKLAAGETRKVSFNLRAERGKVEINASPAAQVFINGKLRGKTPLSVTLLAVKQKITVSKKDYRSVTKSLTPSSRSTKKINVTLQKERVARLGEAKRKYKNSLGMEFKLFTPTKFKMGAPRYEKGQRANEFLRNIELKKPFYVGLHEVTVSQFAKFRRRSGSGGNLPVTSVSWIDAAAFANWLSVREKFKPFYIIQGGRLVGVNQTSDGYRLPSEAEWEWLARKAGRKNQTIFNWGNEFVIPTAYANIADETAKNIANIYVKNYTDGYEKLAPVGSLASDSSGLYDLAGNASEWVHDYYSLVPPANSAWEVDPLGGSSGSNHVIKGSNWRSGSLTELRASFREGAKSGRDDVGFRIARYLYGAEDSAKESKH